MGDSRTGRYFAAFLLAGLLVTTPGWGFSFLQLFGSISDQQEIQVGQEAAAEVESQNPIVRDRTVNQYISSLGQRLVRNSDRRDIPYRFKVINKPEVNAFALPGGFIYVYGGLIQLTGNESELAGVLAHEISHVTERHHVDQMKKARTLGLGLGVLDVILGQKRSGIENVGALGASLFAQGVFFKFSRDAEREADREGVTVMRGAGFNPRGMISLFEKLDSVRKSKPNLVENFFGSHPQPSERERNVSELLQSGDSRLTTDSKEFQRVRQKFNYR